MAAASRNPRSDESDDLRNAQLSDALQIRDMAAIAFALRHGPTVVPLVDGATADADVWTYRDPSSGDVALLLFSDIRNLRRSTPREAALRSPSWLRDYLKSHGDAIASVFFDVAGPHPMQASPGEILRALDA